MVSKKTILALFEESVARFGDNPLLLEKSGTRYRALKYREVHGQVCRCAAGFLSLGVQKGDRIALISEGRNDWVIAELGILFAGAVAVPLSVKIDELPELRFRLDHSGCRIAIASGSQAQKILDVRGGLPELKLLVQFDGLDDPHKQMMSFASLLKRGDDFLSKRLDEFAERVRSVEESDAANICYTSGTSADPKGIVLTHRNYTANVEQTYQVLHFPPSFRTLLILPWDHSFAHLVIYLLIRRGASFASVQVGKTPAETLRNISVNIGEVRPSFMLSVPSLAKSFRKNIEKGIREKGFRVERLFRRALEVAYAYNGNGFRRGPEASLWLWFQYRVYDALIFSKIRRVFGGRMEFFIGGGALLDIEMQKFFYAIGIPMYQGYGLTEAAPVISANVPERHKMGSSGSVVPGLEIRICDGQGRDLLRGHAGEIVVRGENVMAGYWRNEKTTNETVRNGWLHTGDVGYLDADDFLYVLGRQKSLLIGHDGEKYSPEGIEEAIVGSSPCIEQIMLHNNQSQYTSALVVPNRAAIGARVNQVGLTTNTIEGQDAALKLIQEAVDAYRQGGEYAGMFPERWVPAAIAVLEEGFTEQNHLLNSTLKVVRWRVVERYKDRLEYMYTPEGKDVHNPRNRIAIAGIG